MNEVASDLLSLLTVSVVQSIFSKTVGLLIGVNLALEKTLL